jgi:hypothetical protein
LEYREATAADVPVPVPRPLLRRLWIGLAGGALSFVLTELQGAFREGFDSWHQAVSALSLGPGGWLQMINLIAFGVVILTTVGPWRQVLAGARGATAYPVLTALVGACVTVYGVWSIRPSGFAGTFERAAMLAPMVWMFAFLRRLQLGAPLMVIRIA